MSYVQSYKCLFPQDLKMRLQHLWIMVDVKLMASKDNNDICYGPSHYYSSNKCLLNYYISKVADSVSFPLFRLFPKLKINKLTSSIRLWYTQGGTNL